MKKAEKEIADDNAVSGTGQVSKTTIDEPKILTIQELQESAGNNTDIRKFTDDDEEV